MRNLFSTKLALAILFGLVFFVGGAGTALAETEYHFIYHEKKVVPIAPIISPAYQAANECQLSSDTTTKSATGNALDQGCAAGDMSVQQARANQVGKAAAAIIAQDKGPAEIEKFTCSPLLLSITGCFPIVTYYFIYRPTMYLLIGTGYIFDKMLSLSIEGGLVAPPFVDSSWLVVRDFSNMLFIFILIYTGVQTILGFGDWRKTVLNVVIMALLINFSLFFTKVVIDAGNVLAVGIKNSISPGSSISAGLVGAFKPQVFLDTAGKTVVGPMDATVVFIIASIVSGFTAYILFKAAILFSRRLIVFWGLMIMSPFAFISIALPGRANKFKEWTEELISQAFVAPIFLFFIYLIAKVVSAGNILTSVGFAQATDTSGTIGSWFTSLIGPIIVAALIVKALQEALKFSEGFAGSTGEAFSGLVAGAMGMATGGASMAARGLIGGGSAALLRSGMLKEGSAAHMAATAATKASFDVRNLGGKDSIFGETIGGQISKGVGAFGLGKGGGVGGVEKAAQDSAKRATDNVPKMSIFEERGVRDRAAKEAAKRQTGENVSSASAAFGAKLAKEQTTKLEAEVKTAQQLHDESGTAKEVTDTKTAYDEAVSARQKAGTSASKEQMDAVFTTKGAYDKATATHAASGTSVALQEKLEELKKAKQAEQEAVAAQATAEKSTGKESEEDDPVKKENDRRRKNYANTIRRGGDHATADKIEKNEESSHKKKAKEFAAELKKEKEGKARPEVIEHIEEKIAEHEGK